MKNPNNGIATVHGIVTQDQFDLLRRELMNAFHELSERIDEPDEWLTTVEACKYLKVGSTTFYRLIGEGLINKYQIGGINRYNKNELRELLLNDQY